MQIVQDLLLDLLRDAGEDVVGDGGQEEVGLRLLPLLTVAVHITRQIYIVDCTNDCIPLVEPGCQAKDPGFGLGGRDVCL